MEQITLRVQENTLESVESDATEHDKTRSEHIRDILESHTEHGDPEELAERITDLHDRIGEKDSRIEDLEAERDRLADTVDTLEEEIADLESEVESLEARNTDLTNQLAEANTRIDAAGELVEYVETERSAQERYREAGILGKVKYTVFGMDTDENDD